jgi:hypothetical protein
VGTTGGIRGKQPSFAQPRYIVLGFLLTSKDYTLRLYKRCAHVARHPYYGTLRTRAQGWTRFLPGSATCLGSCGGDGGRLQVHEAVKRALKEQVLSNPNPGGASFPASSILIDPPHLRRDKSSPGDIPALARSRCSQDGHINGHLYRLWPHKIVLILLLQ